MKKKNIFLFILLGLITLGFNIKVMADDSIIGFLECKYKFDEGELDPNYSSGHNNVISFYYTEVFFGNSDTGSDTLAVKDGNNFRSIYSLTDKNNSYISVEIFNKKYYDSNIIENRENLDESFRNYLKADGTCPQYILLQHLKTNSYGIKTYIPHFTNDTSELCSQGYDCSAIGVNITGGEKYMIYPKESGWHFELSDEFEQTGRDACDGAEVYLVVGEDKRLRGMLTYPADSNLISGVTVPVLGPVDNVNYKLTYMYNLLKNNTIKQGFIRGDEKTKINFGASGSAKQTCSFTDKNVNPKYNCTTYEMFRSELTNSGMKQVEDSYRIAVTDYQDFAENGLCGDNGDCDYSKYTIEQINELIEKVESKIEYGKHIESMYINLTDYYAEYQNEICASSAEKFNSDLKNIQNMNYNSVGTDSNPDSASNKLKNTLEVLKAQANDFGDESLQNKIDDLLNEVEGLVQRNEHNYSVVEQKFFANVSLFFETGCGLITPKLKTWLIRGFDIMKICALILTLILGMFDFFKGIASGNADTMKKVWTSFSRRLIVVVILFLLPIIFEFAFGVINIDGVISNDPLCGIK